MMKFPDVLDKTEKLSKQLDRELTVTRRLYECNKLKEAFESALRMEETAERMTLLARSLPAYTGMPKAKSEVQKVIAKSIPAEIGYTAEGWFSVRFPALLPKKDAGSADYIRSFLYPAMKRFFDGKPPVKYDDCVLIYRHVYDRESPERRMRDHDNIEVNMVTDIIALYVLPDDSPSFCSHYSCSTMGAEDRTEVYAVPKKHFPIWFILERTMPEAGVRLYKNTKILP